MTPGACMPPRPIPARGTRTGLASRFDDCDGAAQGRLAALETPWKTAELDLLIQHLVDLPAQVLDVDDVVRKQKGVHDLVVGLRENFVQALVELLLRLFRLVGAYPPDDGVHRVVGAAGVDGDPAHAALEHPFGEGAGGPGVTDEVPRLVSLRAVRPVLRVIAVISGMDDQDVAALDAMAGVLLPTLEVLRTVHVVVADAHLLQVDYARGADEEVQGQVADELAARHEVRRRVQVGADVERHGDFLPARPVEREVLDPPDGRSGVPGEGWRVEGEVLREVEVPHVITSLDRSILPIALRGSFSTTTTRRGHLYAARRSRAKAMSSLSSSSAAFARTTYAMTSSPHASLGTPATATSSTAGWVSSTSSTSRGYTLKPPEMISSLSRPRIASDPSSPISPTSPVRKKPSSVNASSVAVGLRQ